MSGVRVKTEEMGDALGFEGEEGGDESVSCWGEGWDAGAIAPHVNFEEDGGGNAGGGVDGGYAGELGGVVDYEG